MSEFLLEIGSGELPYKEVRELHSKIGSAILDFFKLNLRMGGELSVESYSTLRRIVIFSKNLPLKYPDREIEVIGPPLKIAYDHSSAPAVPLIQFMKKNNISDAKRIKIVKLEKGAYVACVKKIKGKSINMALAEFLPGMIKQLQFKKSMFWTSPDVRYPRPILWILALFDNNVVKFSLGDIRSGNISYLLRNCSFRSPSVKIKNIPYYFNKLKENGIILNNDDRKSFIKNMLAKTCGKANAVLMEYDDEFMDEITGMSECPYPVTGNFDHKFLSLPPELLSLVMRKHQRFFPLKDKHGGILPAFVGISNTAADDKNIYNNIKQGYSRVLTARLNDADFFYKDDLKKPVKYFIEKTKNILFYEGLGSYYEKVNRLSTVGMLIGELASFSEKELSEFKKASLLLKFDLASQIVHEFPEMQGIAGRIYAEKAGEDKTVSKAIEEHYFPLSRAGKKIMPSNNVSALCSISDRIDTVISFTLLNKLPDGESDPFAIRRAMIGIIELTMDKKYIFSLNSVFDFYFKNFFKKGEKILQGSGLLPKVFDYGFEKGFKKIAVENLPALHASFISFAKARFKNIMLGMGYKYDEIASVVDDILFDDIYTSFLKIDFISRYKMHEKMYELTFIYKRINNITANYSDINAFDLSKLALPEEKRLIRSFEAAKNKVQKATPPFDYVGFMEAYHKLVSPVNSFFDNVLVLTEDIPLRSSRIGLLNNILAELKKLCDFSKLSY